MITCLLYTAVLLTAQAQPIQTPNFEVATIKQAETTPGRFITMQSNNRFIAKNYTVKLLIAAAYDLNSRTISGGPAWIESEAYDITAVTPGDTRPTHAQQMLMLRTLLTDRFGLTFHREQKDFAIYSLELAKSGAKLTPTTAPPDTPPTVGPATVYPERVALPAKNATLDDFAQLMQRAILDRPVVNNTGLTTRYDFSLEWAPDETQFGGGLPSAPNSASPPLFTAIQQQLGLTLKPTRGPVAALIIDTATKPSAN
jgi:uncharacterized protein (TIGR03435 family)